MTFEERVGAVLRDLRRKKKIRQGVIGEHLGLLQPAVSRMENGTQVIYVERLAKWAEVLGTTASAILRTAEEKKA